MNYPFKIPFNVEDIPDDNRFGAKRKYDYHTGIDLFCDPGQPVYAIEDGMVLSIDYFTGPNADSEWWNETFAVTVEGKSGVILYGEIKPHKVGIGGIVRSGDIIGYVLTVLKEDKGKPMTMLHIELYKKGYLGSGKWWRHDKKMPNKLLNVETLFKK